MGGLALLGLVWGRRPKPAGAAEPDPGAGRTNPVLVTWLFLLLLAIASGATWAWRNNQKAGTREAPGAGAVISMGRGELEALDNVWTDQSGFIVWSSTMHGQHDLVRFDWPSGRLTRLTTDPHVDRFPKISPEGKRVVFVRSRQEWVSFRNNVEWDVWVLALASGKERRIAEFGTDPGWTADGQSIVFNRTGVGVVQANVKTGEETVLLASRERERFETPSLHPAGNRLAATLRGKRRGTVLVDLPSGRETPVAGGCQLAYAPGGEWLVLVEDGGRMKNRICRTDREGRNLETLMDMPGAWSHEYFPRVSNDGTLLVFGASREGHEHDTADYEIFLWRIGDPWDQAARVSFHTGNDQWPDIWVHPAR
jgi:Tol biopolymer transport system component